MIQIDHLIDLSFPYSHYFYLNSFLSLFIMSTQPTRDFLDASLREGEFKTNLLEQLAKMEEDIEPNMMTKVRSLIV